MKMSKKKIDPLLDQFIVSPQKMLTKNINWSFNYDLIFHHNNSDIL